MISSGGSFVNFFTAAAAFWKSDDAGIAGVIQNEAGMDVEEEYIYTCKEV